MWVGYIIHYYVGTWELECLGLFISEGLRGVLFIRPINQASTCLGRLNQCGDTLAVAKAEIRSHASHSRSGGRVRQKGRILPGVFRELVPRMPTEVRVRLLG